MGALSLGSALASSGSREAATATSCASEWSMMYSIASSPSVSYSGTHTMLPRLHAWVQQRAGEPG